MKIASCTSTCITTGIVVFAAFAAPLVEGFAGGGGRHKKNVFLHQRPPNNNNNKLAHARNEKAAATVAPLFMSKVVGDPSNVMALSSSSSSSFYTSSSNNNNNTVGFAAVEMTSAAYSDDMVILTTTTTTTTTATTTRSNDILLDNPLFQQEQQRVIRWNTRTNIFGNNVLQQPSATMGRFICLTAAAIYGTNFATVKMLDQVMPLAVSAALRFGLAAFVVATVVLGQEEAMQQNNNDNNINMNVDVAAGDEDRWRAMMLGAEVGAWYAVGYLCQAMGLHMVDASKSAFFNALAVIVVPLLDVAFKKAKLGARGLGSIAMALGGVALLQLGPATSASNSLFTVTSGDLFCVAQALFFGIGYWRLEKAATDFPNQAGRITMGQLLGVAAGSLLYCATTDLPSFALVAEWLSNPFVWQALVWTGLFSTALALYLETIALKAISATELTILMTSVSLWGSAFAYMSIGEVLKPIGMLGGFLILSGCLLSALKPQEKKDVDVEEENVTFAP